MSDESANCGSRAVLLCQSPEENSYDVGGMSSVGSRETRTDEDVRLVKRMKEFGSRDS